MKQKILETLLYMQNNYLSLSEKSGCDYFEQFLLNNNVKKSDLKKNTFVGIVKDYWDLNLTELYCLAYSFHELKYIDKQKYNDLLKEYGLYEMYKS